MEQLTGPDYLMVADDMLKDKPYADAYKAMLFDAFSRRTRGLVDGGAADREWTGGRGRRAGRRRRSYRREVAIERED